MSMSVCRARVGDRKGGGMRLKLRKMGRRTMMGKDETPS